ncbi:hypothetical protein TrST_g6702 [Triparma strigata]|uniref:Uncharacterized protein n=1 Tax=Triparma strigata TaxID=1606541 RepID=A0A9W7A4U6_9STRA|nr:hypothetical protein TrST_g6702 [Triparma strigata]
MKHKIVPDIESPPTSELRKDEKIEALESENKRLRRENEDVVQEVKQLRRELAEAGLKGGPIGERGALSVERTVTQLPLVGDLEVLLAFFCEVMKPRNLVPTLPPCEKTANLVHSDCVTLAKGFNYVSKTSGSDEDAVGTFIKKYPIMEELRQRNPTLEEILVLTSCRLANDGKKYAAVRLIFGALLSAFDTITDIYMIYVYYSTGATWFGNASAVSLLSNVTLQMILVYLQNSKQSKWRVFKEEMYVLTFTKPGIDVYRVVQGAEPLVGSFLCPKSEMIYTKLCELFAEALAGTLIQTYAYLTGSEQSSVAIFSLIVSVFTASFTATGISFDKDLDKHGRDANPAIYGYVPSKLKKKAAVFMLMFLMSACQLISKVLAIALCAVVSSSTVFAYLAIDLTIYCVYKLLRRHFWYWIPLVGASGIMLSFTARVAGKLLVDFTALLHARHPYELGGVYWAFTLLSTPVVCLVFGSRYLNYVESEDGKAAELSMILDSTQVYGIIGCLFVVQATAFLLFLKNINPEYIQSFYSAKTGNEQVMGSFMDYKDGEHKLLIFTDNHKKWTRIREEVMEWVNEKIPEWNNTKPEWWDARRKATIPDWAVKDPELLRSIRSQEVVEVQERRGSFAVAIGEDQLERNPSDAGAVRRRSILLDAKQQERETA